jgi:hypothetical protein
MWTPRDSQVDFDRDLAVFYGVTTGNLNKAVSRNVGRFPGDFMLVLTKDELANLIFQTGISSWGSAGATQAADRFPRSLGDRPRTPNLLLGA